MGLKQVVHPKCFNFNIAIHVQHGQPFQKLLFSVLVVVNFGESNLKVMQ